MSPESTGTHERDDSATTDDRQLGIVSPEFWCPRNFVVVSPEFCVPGILKPVDASSAYVAISRAREGAAIYTDSRAKLTEALGIRDGSQVGAIDAPLPALEL